MEQSQKGKKKKVYTKQITALVFLGVLALLCLFNLVLGNKKAEKPKFDINNVLNGEYMEEYEEYFSERLSGGKLLASLNDSVETLFGKRVSNGIWKGRDEYLLEEIATPDEKNLEKNIQSIGSFSENYYNIPVYFMLVPNAANIQSDKMPAYHIGRDQKKQFDEIRESLGAGINWVDVTKALKKHEDEDIYYRTDRNWTTLGAYYGYETLASAMKLDTSKAPKLEPYVVNNDFAGSLSRISGYGKSYEDSITIYAPENLKDNVEILVTNGDTDSKSATLYDKSKLEGREKYDLFLGGDYGLLDIRTTAETTDRLLMFKDSYANCLIPFLVPYYREIVVIDPALYEGNLMEVMQGVSFTSILFLYNGNSFVTDANISKVLEVTQASGTQQGTAATEAEGDAGTDGAEVQDKSVAEGESSGSDEDESGVDEPGSDESETNTGDESSGSDESESDTDADTDIKPQDGETDDEAE